jgi:hypothetical protein
MYNTAVIESAELRFRQILEEFFISIYDEKSLPSHGISHHRRVWSHAKDLLLLPLYHDESFSINLPYKLIVASYLHDIGMSVDQGPRHGIHSRDLCMEFFSKNNLRPEDFVGVPEAIQDHDRKEYPDPGSDNPVLTILSIADDLDAFGFTGIYRYTEIYINRGIGLKVIGDRIRENAGIRFSNFKKTRGITGEFLLKHKERFNILDNFFNEYNKQVADYNFGGLNPHGYCGIIDLFTSLIKGKKNIEEIHNIPEKYIDDPIIEWYFNGLRAESIQV